MALVCCRSSRKWTCWWNSSQSLKK